jgi:SulP family sulfate permease
MRKRPVFSPRSLKFIGKNRDRISLVDEAVSGITVGLIALPLALALGIASIPAGADTPLSAPALGIITAIIGGIIVSLFGGSRVQIGGPTAAFIPIVLMIISEHGYSGLILASIMAGCFLVLMGVTRMGSLIKFIPWPVTSGFTTGIAVSIMMTQIPDFLGFPSHSSMPKEFFEKIPWYISLLKGVNPLAVTLSISSVLLILFWPKFKIKRLPGSIVAMVVCTLVVYFFHWGDTQKIATIGSQFGQNAIPSSLPAFALPQWNMQMVHDLMGPALAIALLGAIESLLSAVVSDGLTNDRHNSNTELIAQGLANIICPFFGGLPTTGAIARTSANISNGGKSPLAGVIHSLFLLTIILVASDLATYIPMPVMSAVLIVVALKMGEWNELKQLKKMPKSDAFVLLLTFSLTVVFDLVVAVEVGMVLAAILFIKRITETTEVSCVTSEDMLERPEHIAQGKPIPEGVLVYRIFGPFMFGAAEKMQDAFFSLDQLPHVLILRLHLVTAMDATGMNALHSIITRMKNHNGTVILSGIHQQPLQMFKKAGFIEEVEMANFCATFDDALKRSAEVLKNKKMTG